jgi:hypothetical protein
VAVITASGNRNFVPCVANIMGLVERMGTKYVNSIRKLLVPIWGEEEEEEALTWRVQRDGPVILNTSDSSLDSSNNLGA